MGALSITINIIYSMRAIIYTVLMGNATTIR